MFKFSNLQSQEGSTALHYAAMNGNSEMVKLLLRAGAVCVPDKV